MKVSVVIPCYRCSRHLRDVLNQIGSDMDTIYCVDDACPEETWKVAKSLAASDPRIVIIKHDKNMGVGGAMISGYRQALADGADIIVKLDGDGQMAPKDIPILIAPLVRGEADYVKGNRFFDLSSPREMPLLRLIGNAGLSFLSKVSSGYWNIFDPTNGFTAIHSVAAKLLPMEKIERRWFFESDMLFRLNTLRAAVRDVHLNAKYGDEKSNLNPIKAFIEFPFKLTRNFLKRIFYNYFLRDFNAASFHLLIAVLLMSFGVSFGSWQWLKGGLLNIVATPGTVMLAALPIILGFQSLLSFMQFDVANIPSQPLQRYMGK